MPIEFVPMTRDLQPAVRRFNQRMQAGKAPADFLLPEAVRELDPRERSRITRQHFAAFDGEEVRGGFLEVWYPGWFGGAEQPVLNVQAPLSEGLVDARYLMLPAQMIKQFLNRSPQTFIVGMGDARNPLPRVLRAAGWHVAPIPFFFRFCHASLALTELRPFRAPGWRRRAAQLAAATGGGAVAIHAVQALKGARWRPGAGWAIEDVAHWDDWADAIWSQARSAIRFAVSRDRATLECLYRAEDARLRRFKISHRGRPAAWVVASLSRFRGHRHFGDLPVATILDGCATAGSHAPALALAVEALDAEGPALVIGNFCETNWVAAFRRTGFLSGPSNYLLATAPSLARALGAAPADSGAVHVARGDADGRVHL